MTESRRELLARTAAVEAASAQTSSPAPVVTPAAGTPPAFGTSPPVGPEVSPATFAEAEKLVRVAMNPAERAQAAGNWRRAMAQLYERRTGPRQVEIEPGVAPYSQWNPILPGQTPAPQRARFAWSKTDPGTLPSRDEDIAFAPVTRLARWIETRQLKSERLTQIYLARLKRFDPKLRCVITLTEQLALEQARQADQEIAAGK